MREIDLNNNAERASRRVREFEAKAESIFEAQIFLEIGKDSRKRTGGMCCRCGMLWMIMAAVTVYSSSYVFQKLEH